MTIKSAVLALCMLPGLAFGQNESVIDNVFNYNEVTLKFGGWSKHSTGTAYDTDYNESHNGIGLEWMFRQSENKRHNLGLGVWKMTDSFSMDETHLGGLYTFKPETGNALVDAVDFNLAVYWMERGYRKVSAKTKDTLCYYSKSGVFAHPYITINITDSFNVDVMYIPEMDGGAIPEVWFVRGGINLTNLFY